MQDEITYLTVLALPACFYMFSGILFSLLLIQFWSCVEFTYLQEKKYKKWALKKIFHVLGVESLAYGNLPNDGPRKMVFNS